MDLRWRARARAFVLCSCGEILAGGVTNQADLSAPTQAPTCYAEVGNMVLCIMYFIMNTPPVEHAEPLIIIMYDDKKKKNCLLGGGRLRPVIG
jgi:hypothetical protein